jgi:hypothetical protein
VLLACTWCSFSRQQNPFLGLPLELLSDGFLVLVLVLLVLLLV